MGSNNIVVPEAAVIKDRCSKSSRPEVFCKKDVHRNFAKFTEKQLGQSLLTATLLKKKLAQVFSFEFCEISKNTFSYRTPPVAASSVLKKFHEILRKTPMLEFF